MRLCENCLMFGDVRETPVGYASGSQRDPVQARLELCVTCRDALVSGELGTFSGRYTSERNIKRP